MKILKKGRTVLKLTFILDVLVISKLVQRQVKQTTKDTVSLKTRFVFQPLTFSTVPAGTKLDRFQSVYKERAAIPYVDRNVEVTTVIKAMKTNFSGNDSFINCWVCSVHPTRHVRSTSMVQ